jgi:uncharacterized membrane protein YkvA (DUF1232 family)
MKIGCQLGCYNAMFGDMESSITEPTESEYLELFPSWLGSLAVDARALSVELERPEVPAEARAYLAAALNYIFKSVDLIPDGIDDLGYLDDAFVVRVCARAAYAAGAKDAAIEQLAVQGQQVEWFLNTDYSRLTNYVDGLRKGAARGRSVADILDDASVRAGFLVEVNAWSLDYQTPKFAADSRTLIKLRAFLHAKLP